MSFFLGRNMKSSKRENMFKNMCLRCVCLFFVEKYDILEAF
jgi:hypothetical protein